MKKKGGGGGSPPRGKSRFWRAFGERLREACNRMKSREIVARLFAGWILEIF